MFAGHDPYLVALSVVIAILGGYTGFGLTARIRGTPDAGHRAAARGRRRSFLAIGIWTMHFVGMLAAPMPAGYRLSGAADHRFVPDLRAGGRRLAVLRQHRRAVLPRVVSSAVLLGAGIVSMHYVGIHGLAGNFAMTHDTPWCCCRF